MRPLLLLLLTACAEAPSPVIAVPAPLPALGSARSALAAPRAGTVAPMPGATACVALPGAFPGELTGCYDATGHLRGVELDTSPEATGAAIVAVRDAYAQGDVVAVGGSAWTTASVRLEVVADDARVHVRAQRRDGLDPLGG